MPQTREHARVCEELGIRRAVVVLTKSDLVDAETLALAEAEALDLLRGRFEATVVSCSTLRATGVDAVRDAVAACLRSLPTRPTDGPARLWVDRVLSIRGAGTVVTGTLSSGELRRGDELVVLGAGTIERTVARELRVHDQVVDVAHSPTRLAVNLPSSHARRGDLLTSETGHRLTRLVDAELRGGRLARGAEVSIHMGSAHVPARVTRIEAVGGPPADDGVQLARLVLEHGRPMRGGDRFVVRGSGGATDASVTCGGTVIDALPHPRSRGEIRRELVRAVRAADPKEALSVLLRQVAPRPLDLPDLSGRLGIDQARLVREAEAQLARGEIVAVGSAVLARPVLLELADHARKLVADHARRAPLDRGLPVATLQQQLAQRAGAEAADVAIRAARARRSAADTDLIAIEGDVAVLAHRARAVDPGIADAVERARGVLATAGMHGASLGKVGDVTAAPADQARAMLAFLERQGAAVRAGDLWFAREVVDELRERLVRHLEGSGTVTVIEFKSLGDVPRKQAVLLLEHFDQVGLTRRKGDVRVMAREG